MDDTGDPRLSGEGLQHHQHNTQQKYRNAFRNDAEMADADSISVCSDIIHLLVATICDCVGCVDHDDNNCMDFRLIFRLWNPRQLKEKRT